MSVTKDQEIAALKKNIAIMELSEKVISQTRYADGREDERRAVLEFIGWGSASCQIRTKLRQDIEAKRHLAKGR